MGLGVPSRGWGSFGVGGGVGGDAGTSELGSQSPIWAPRVQGRRASLISWAPAATNSGSLSLPGSEAGTLSLEGRKLHVFRALISAPYRHLFAHREFKHGLEVTGPWGGAAVFALLLPGVINSTELPSTEESPAGTTSQVPCLRC